MADPFPSTRRPTQLMPPALTRHALLAITVVSVVIKITIGLQSYAHYPAASPVLPDAYYYFSIADNIAHGHGITHDRTTPTDGFQPLYQFLLVPLFLMSNKYAAINLCLLLGVALHILTIRVLYSILSRYFDAMATMLAVTLYASSAVVTRTALNGMETALSTFVLLATLHAYLVHVRNVTPANISGRKVIVAGVLVACLYLARFDNLIAIGLLFADYLLHQRRHLAALLSPVAIGKAAALIVVSLLVSGPWIAYCVDGFGSPIPMSGLASRLIAGYATSLTPGRLILSNIKSALVAGLAGSDPLIGTLQLLSARALGGVMRNLASVALCTAGFSLVLSALHRSRGRRERPLLVFGFAYMFALMAMYPLSMPVNWYYPRYFAFLGIVFAIAQASALDRLVNVRATVRRCVHWMMAAGALGMVVMQVHYLDTHESFGPTQEAVAWIVAHTDPNRDVIGMFQAEVVPYYIRNRFVDLDGKANCLAMEALRQDRGMEFARAQDVGYLVDRSDVLAWGFRRFGRFDSGDTMLVRKYSVGGQTWCIYKLRRGP